MSMKNKHILEHISWSKFDSREEIFTTIYENNLWFSEESVSGRGSELAVTKSLLINLKNLLVEYNIKTIVDAPCGDYNWFKELDYEFVKYYGIDVVKNIIETNRAKYGAINIEFVQGDILSCSIPKADLILCRDCFIHLNFEEIITCIKNFKRSGSKYLLTTNYEKLEQNNDVITGQFRKIDLTKAPINLPSCTTKIIDNSNENKFLYLWNMEEITL